MFNKANYKPTRNLKSKLIYYEEFSSLDRKMGFYLKTGASIFQCFQIAWTGCSLVSEIY